MAEVIADCPRCAVRRVSFTIKSNNYRGKSEGWKDVWEAFCVCHHCGAATVFILVQSDVNISAELDQKPE